MSKKFSVLGKNKNLKNVFFFQMMNLKDPKLNDNYYAMIFPNSEDTYIFSDLSIYFSKVLV